MKSTVVLGDAHQTGLVVLLQEYRRNGMELLADSGPDAWAEWGAVCDELEARVEALMDAARRGSLTHG